MPSPLGHALGGLAGGSAVAPRANWRLLALFATAGMLPDIDFLLPIQHRGPSHSVTAAVLAFVLTLVIVRLRGARSVGPRVAAAVGVAYLSHILLDWLGQDTSSPQGIMALWPFSYAFHVSGIDLFYPVDRRYWTPEFWRGNALAATREVLVLAPLVWLVRAAGRRRGSTGSGTGQPWP